ncbi:MAG: tetratricopeptide repeat protein [Bacteroidales bacterium]|nr:MAG: tetratricopeptide repeat protein [Bacteroidales bacterium]
MKAIFITSLFVLLSSVFSFNAKGQKGVEDGSKYGHGEDSIWCVRNYSLYNEYYRQDNFQDALPYWKIVIDECPLITSNIYLHGVRMYDWKLKNAKETDIKYAYLDTMMMIYDQRIKYFGREGYVTGRKGIDFLEVRRDNIDDIQKGYDLIKRSISLQNERSQIDILVTFMTASSTLFEAGRLDGEKVIDNYSLVSDILDKQLANKPDDENLQRGKEAADNVFATSGAATCDGLISLFSPKFKQNPTDLDLMVKALALLGQTQCTESNFYFELSTAYHKQEPTAKSAYLLAQMNNDRKNYETAARYYKEAVELETDNVEKAKYYLKLGDITYRELGNHSLARTYALNAIEADPTSGHPYMLIGSIYAASKACAEDELGEKAIYWVSVDYFIKAKTIDPELAEIANRNISLYSQHFPDNETIFFHGFKEGDEYQIECWINEKTKVRAR